MEPIGCSGEQVLHNAIQAHAMMEVEGASEPGKLHGFEGLHDLEVGLLVGVSYDEDGEGHIHVQGNFI